jgi:hypothetical protein
MEIIYPSIGISFLFIFLGLIAYAAFDYVHKFLLSGSAPYVLGFFTTYFVWVLGKMILTNPLILFSFIFYLICFLVGLYLTKKLDKWFDEFLFHDEA